MLRLCVVLKAYNKSSGYRWSAIPKPPPRGVDRLYGTHSVLSALRVFAQGTYATKPTSPSSPIACTATRPAEGTAVQTQTAMPRPHPFRASLFCLYVRDFSLDEPSSSSAASSSYRSQAKPAPSPPSPRVKKTIPARYTTLHRIVALAKLLKVPVRFVPRAELVQLCGERRNQHAVLEVSAFAPIPIHSLADLFSHDQSIRTAVATAAAGTRHDKIDAGPLCPDAPMPSPSTSAPPAQPKRRVVLFLDHIIDPTNVGNILRTAYFNGVDDVILSVDSASCTPAVARTSTGFIEYMRVFQTTTPTSTFLSQSLKDCATSRAAQLDIIATTTSEKARAALARADPTDEISTCARAPPVQNASCLAEECGGHVQVLLLGNEDRGLPNDVVRLCTHTMHVRSIRQEQLSESSRRPDVAVLGHTTAATQTTQDGADDEEDAKLHTSPTRRDGDSHEAEAVVPVLDYAVRRLWQLRPKEVTLNVNAACSAMLCLLTSEAYAAHVVPMPAATQNKPPPQAPTPTQKTAMNETEGKI